MTGLFPMSPGRNRLSHAGCLQQGPSLLQDMFPTPCSAKFLPLSSVSTPRPRRVVPLRCHPGNHPIHLSSPSLLPILLRPLSPATEPSTLPSLPQQGHRLIPLPSTTLTHHWLNWESPFPLVMCLPPPSRLSTPSRSLQMEAQTLPRQAPQILTQTTSPPFPLTGTTLTQTVEVFASQMRSALTSLSRTCL